MARNFNGSTDDLTVASVPVTAPPFSMAAYFRIETDSDGVILALGDEGQANHTWRLLTESSGNLLRLQARTTSTDSLSALTSWSLNTWHHALGVVAAIDDRRVYLDGGGKATTTASKSISAPDSLTMGRTLANTVFFDGDLAWAAVWSAVLGDNDALTLAAGVPPWRVQPGNLVFFAPIIGRSPEPDFTSGGRDLTVDGTTVAANPPVQPLFGYRRRGMIFAAAAPPPTGIEILRRRREGC
jgi:hypothetical protein